MPDELIRRIRHGLWLYVLVAVASLSADLLTRRPEALAVGAIRCLGIVAALGGHLVLPRLRTVTAAHRLIQGVFAVIVAASVGQDAITHDPYSTQLLVAMLALLVAVAVPWRWQDQLVFVAVGAAGVVGNWLLVGGPAYVRLNTLLAAAGSVVVAIFVQRERDALAASRARARASEARLRQIADHAREVFWTLELGGDRPPELSYLSPAARTLLGLAPSAPARAALLERIHPDDRERLNGFLALAAHVRDPGTVDFRIRTPQGEERFVQARFTPIRDAAGAVVRVGGVLEDVTTERLAATALARARDEAEATARLRSQFLAAMSHEISTPLTAILGTLELVRDPAATAAQRRRWETVQTSAQSLHLLLSDVLDFSKSEAGELRLQPAPFDLGELVAGIVELHAARARGQGLDLRFEWRGPLLARTVGDAGRLRQVLNNLLSNAIKFTPRGSVCLRAAPTPGAPGTLRFEVDDTGIGVPAEARTRIFHPFTQADASIAPRFGGNGLGLAIAARLVASMGGAIGVESVGAGSRFWFTLPRGAGAPADAVPAALGGRRLLVVGAGAGVAELVAHGRQGGAAMQSVGVADAAAVLRGAASDGAAPPDAVLLVVDDASAGEGQVRALLGDRRGPELPPILVVAATGRGGDAAVSIEVGAIAWLAAPLWPETLAQRLAACWAPAVPAPAGPPPMPRGRILVVDDSEVVLGVTRELLRGLGQDVATARSGAEALAQLGGRPVDLVLLDCQMPEMDGFETARRIRAGEGGSGRCVPIVAFSAGAPELYREQCLAAGMDDCLAKPIPPSALRTLLARWLPTPAAGEARPAPACDRERLAELAGGDAAAVRRYGDLFAGEARDVIGAIRAAAGDEPPADLPAAVHRVRGAAAYVGALRFEAALAGVAVARGQAAALAAIAQELTVALAEFEHAARALERELAPPRPA